MDVVLSTERRTKIIIMFHFLLQMILKLQIKSGVIFFGHVPCTFGDVQLTKFFSRYGRIVRVRVFHKVQVFC
jgi:hypothetical protein